MTQIQEFLDQQRREFLTDTNNNKQQDYQTETQNHNNNQLKNLTITSTLDNRNGKHKNLKKEIISIATHNVRGVNNELDQNNIIIEMQNKTQQ